MSTFTKLSKTVRSASALLALAAATPGIAQDAHANLFITKSDGVTYIAPGATTKYGVSVTNQGPDPVPSITVADPVPAGLASCSWTCTGIHGGVCGSGGTGGIADVANLPVNASVQYVSTCTVDAAAGGTIVNTASFTTPPGVINIGPTGNVARDTTYVIGPVDLAVALDTPYQAPGAPPGGLLMHALIAANDGTHAIGDVNIKCELPISTSWTCTAAGGATCPAQSGSGAIWHVVGMPPGATIRYQLMRMATTTDAIFTRATIYGANGVAAGDYDLNNNVATALTPVQTAQNTDLVLSIVGRQERAMVDGDVIHDLRVRNDGTVTANAQIYVQHSPYLTDPSWTCSGTGGATCGAASLNAFERQFSHGVNLPPGAEATIVLSSWLHPSAAAGMSEAVVERATAYALGINDLAPESNSATATTAVSLFYGSFGD